MLSSSAPQEHPAGHGDAGVLHVAHLISNLNVGGAENSLCTLIEATTVYAIRHTVISLLPRGVLKPRLEAAGARVIELDSRRGLLGAIQLAAIANAIDTAGADLLQCWMYHANVAASSLQLMRRVRCPVFWGVRQGLQTVRHERYATQAVIGISVALSRLPTRIVYNSQEAAADHERIGFRCASRVVIENGIDCERFRPRAEARSALREMIGAPQDAEIVGRIARFATMKDFVTLFQAFALVAAERPRARLVVIGPSQERELAQLLALAATHRCQDRLHVLAPRLDIEHVYAGMDVVVSSSSVNEGFPNTIAEALASGVLVASTTVGETRLIRDGCHRFVNPRSVDEMAAGITSLIALDPDTRSQLSRRGREFIEQNFNSGSFANRFARLWVRSSPRYTMLAKAT